MGMFDFIDRAKAIFAEGRQIVFLGGDRQIREFHYYHYNEQTGKIALVLIDIEKLGKKETTDYVFDPEDFSPNPLHVDWDSHFTVYLCYRSIDGTKHFMPGEIKQWENKVSELTHENEMFRRQVSEMRGQAKTASHTQDTQARVLHDSKMLQDLKKIMGPVITQEQSEVKNPFDFNE